MPITGFEEQTQSLTEYEKNTLVPILVAGFTPRVGKDKAIKNAAIVAKLKPQYKISEVRVRKLVNYIRTKGILPNLMATSNGYYLTNDLEELAGYCDSLEQRSNEIRKVMECIQAHIRTEKQK